jgi:cytoskeletal protein RodZ
MERERRKLTVHQVADATNIKTDHVRALEASEWRAFAAPVYIRGFTRTYARHLHLDDRALIEALDAELDLTEDYSSPPSLSKNAKGPLDAVTFLLSRVRWEWIVPLILGGLVLALGAYGYRAWQKNALAAKKAPQLGSGLRPAIRPAPATLPLPTNSPAGRR